MSRRSKRKLRGDPGSQARSVSIARPSGNRFPSEAQLHNHWRSLAVCLLLALAVWAVFGQTTHYQFVNYDDDVYVYENPIITQGLSLHAIVWIFTHDNGPNEWLPLTAISRMVDWQLFGPNAGGHHLTNVLLHGANAILLFLGLRKMTGAMWRSAFVAAVFAIHPLRVESVAWVTERKDVLSGLFFMLTLWTYVCYAQNQGARSQEPGPESRSAFWFLGSPCYWLALLFFTLGLLSKTMLVTLPFVLLLLDYWPLGRFAIDDLRFTNSRSLPSRVARHASLLWEKVPFLLLSAAACVATVLTQKHLILDIQGLTFPSRIGNALVAYAAYLWQMLYPVGLAVFYLHPGNHLSVWKVGLSVLVLILISSGVLAGRRRYPYLLMGWLWYLGMLVPVIGLIQVGEQARADRYTYLPQIGMYILLAWGVVELCGCWRYRRAVLGSAAAAILAGLLAGAYVQTGYWKNSVSLWTHMLACASGNFVAHGNLGLALAAQGKLAEAIQHYERALQLNPDYADAYNSLGNALVRQGKVSEAIQHFERALQLNPDYADAYNNLGIALAGQGKLAEAIQHYERALQLNPNEVEAHNNLGVALASHGKWDEAIQHYEQALQLKPDYLAACYNLGVALAAQGRLNEAIAHFQQALALATAQGNTALAESIRSRLKSYQSALPEPQTP